MVKSPAHLAADRPRRRNRAAVLFGGVGEVELRVPAPARRPRFGEDEDAAAGVELSLDDGAQRSDVLENGLRNRADLQVLGRGGFGTVVKGRYRGGSLCVCLGFLRSSCV